MSKWDPLAPGTVDVRLKFSNQTTTLPGFNALQEYGGQPLFCHAQSDHKTLSILIDDLPGADVQSNKMKLPNASHVTVTMMLAGTLITAWDPVALPYDGIQAINFSATMSESLGTLHLCINDDRLVTDPDQGHKNGYVAFVLVQQETEFQIVWINDPTSVIRNADTLTDARVVLPNDSVVTSGGITGPMGFTVP